MKKILCALLIVLLVFAFAGCGNKVQNGSGSQDDQGTVQSENKVSNNNSGSENEEKDGSAGKYLPMNLGEKYSLDFVEFTVDEVSCAQELLPDDTSGVYSYNSDQENQQYFYLKGKIKNIGGEAYSVEDVAGEIIFDDQYKYNATLEATQGDDFYGDYLNPFEEATYYLYASVPDELLSQYKTVVFKLGIPENFDASFPDFDECPYLYQLTATK